MKESLQKKLLNELQVWKIMPFSRVEEICRTYHFKQSNAEKRLREFREPLHKNYHPEIGVEKNEHGAIIAYTWKMASQEAPQQAQTRQAEPMLTRLGSNSPYQPT